MVKAVEVTASLAESNGSLPLSGWLKVVTCRLIACTPGLALGPVLGNKYGNWKTTFFAMECWQ